MRFLRSKYALLLGLLVCGGVLLLCLLASIRFGAAEIGNGDMISAFTDYDGSEEDLIIRTLRVPRALIAALVGASLAIAGAALAVVIAIYLFGASSLSTYAFFAFLGAALSAVAV